MKRLALIHTVAWYQKAVTQPFFDPLLEKHPDLEIMNIMDDTLLSDSIRAGSAPDEVLNRIVGYGLLAQNAGADMVMCSCTTVNRAMEIARESGKFHIPVLNIDEPMAELAVKSGKKFGVVATLHTSPQGTCYLLEREAKKLGKEIDIEVVVCPEAFEALMNDNVELHDRLVREEIDKLAERVDVIVLGQISLSQVKHSCSKPILQTGIMAGQEIERILKL